MNPKCAVFLFTATLAVSSLSVFAQSNGRQGTAQTMAVSAAKRDAQPIAALQGPSWLKHLGLTISQSRMGQMGGTDPAPSATANNLSSIMQRFLATFRSSPEKASEILNEKFVATGSDLYRWNCQACHGADGKGAAPEINSLLGPVQGTSPALTKKRMEARGIDPDDDMVKQVSELAEASLRDRFQHGGKSMPSFEYLRGDEIEALLGYLEKLASVPPTKRDGLVVQESAARVGEQIAKGTCHICHDATGPGAGRSSLVRGTIPSLASMPRDNSLSGVVHQVQYGSATLMKVAGAEVMPAYPYFTQEEIAATYLSGGGTPGAAPRNVATDRGSQR